jgi:hypothetical protein
MALAVLAGMWLAQGILGASVSSAAPAAIPTPIVVPATGPPQNVTFFGGTVLTADTRSNSVQIPSASSLDLQYEIDETTVNTTTLRIDFSNDPLCTTTPASAEWSPGINVVASAAADTDQMVQVQNFGRCTSIFADVTNSNQVTVTVRAVAK